MPPEDKDMHPFSIFAISLRQFGLSSPVVADLMRVWIFILLFSSSLFRRAAIAKT
jgi:hypothetical protein